MKQRGRGRLSEECFFNSSCFLVIALVSVATIYLSFWLGIFIFFFTRSLILVAFSQAIFVRRNNFLLATVLELLKVLTLF